MLPFTCLVGLVLAGLTLLLTPASAQTSLWPAALPRLGVVPDSKAPAVPFIPPAAKNPDPLIGSVEGHLIYLSDIPDAQRTLPNNIKELPFEVTYPLLLDRMVDQEALVIMARRIGLEDRRDVQREIQQAVEHVLERAYIAETVDPQITEKAIEAAYIQQYASHPASEEVHVRHIVVSTESEARKVLNDLAHDADFATLARVVSKSPDAARGGDLGFVRRDEVSPDLADVAFSLQPGQVAPEPVHGESGWDIVKVEERRLLTPPGLSEVHDQLRDQLLARATRRAVVEARGQLSIREFNVDGTEIRAPADVEQGHRDPAR